MSAILFGLLAGVKKAYPVELVTQGIYASGTWNKPSDMVGDVVWVSGCGGGGGGGGVDSRYTSAAGGSGAVSVLMQEYPLNGASSVIVEIGAGGAGGSSAGGNGGNGGNTVFGDLVIPGGVGGLGGNAANHTASPMSAYNDGIGTASDQYIATMACGNYFDGGTGGRGRVKGAGGMCTNRAVGISEGYYAGGGGGNTLFGRGGNGFVEIGNGAPTGAGGGGGGAGLYGFGFAAAGDPGANGVLFITYPRRLTE